MATYIIRRLLQAALVLVIVSFLIFIAMRMLPGDPAQVLAEALRVARCGLILGMLNRHSVLSRQLSRAGGPIWEAARFFTVAELIHLVRQAANERPMKVLWRTTLWPLWSKPLLLPWGGFIGMSVMLL